MAIRDVQTSLTDSIESGHKAIRHKISKIAHRMAKKGVSFRDPRDSDALREYSRTDENGKKLYRMPEGTYKNVGGRYVKQDNTNRGVVHDRD